MKKFIYQFFTVTALTAGLASQAVAVPTYLGSWQVDQGLWWSNTPQEYSGQQAAALLFGATTGDYNPNDYVISTNGVSAASINNAAWYSVYAANGAYKGPAPISSFISGQGIAQGLVLPQNFTNDTNGYVSPGDVSAYVHDWANGSTFTNYAFYNAPTTSVPEPESMPLIGLGLLGLVLARRKTQKA